MLLNDQNVPISDPIAIGNVRLRNRCFLAPMSGITDAAFRNLAWKFGAGLVVSEMVASEALLEGDEEMAPQDETRGYSVSYGPACRPGSAVDGTGCQEWPKPMARKSSISIWDALQNA